MLQPDRFYIPDFEAETTPRTFTPDLRGLIAWLETQDGASEYDWASIHGCLLRQFANARGYEGSYTSMLGGLGSPFQRQAEILAHTHPRTFAAALTRARSLLDRSA